MLYRITDYQSPVGRLILASDGSSLTGLWLEGQKYFGGTLGEHVRDDSPDVFRAAKDLSAESGLRPRLYMWCGTEDFLFQQNVRMKRHLKRLKYDLTWEQSPGDHQWKYWDQKIQTVLDWLPLGGEED